MWDDKLNIKYIYSDKDQVMINEVDWEIADRVRRLKEIKFDPPKDLKLGFLVKKKAGLLFAMIPQYIEVKS